MKMDDYRMTNLVHIDGDERHTLIEAFLKARKAINERDKLQYGSVDVFVYGYLKPPRIEASKDGMSYKMTWHDDVLSFEFDYHHGDEILHGKYHCSMDELIKFEKAYRRASRFKRAENMWNNNNHTHLYHKGEENGKTQMA